MTPSPAAGGLPGRLRILVVGGGAVGSFLGAMLAIAGEEVTLVRLGEPATERFALRLHGPGRLEHTAVVRRIPSVAALAEGTGSAPVERPDLLVFAVKMFELEGALADCAALPGIPALTIENGIGAEELVAERRPGAGVVAGSLTVALQLAAPDEVRRHSRGALGLAVASGDTTALADRLAADFERAGLRTKRIADARSMKWSKLLTNLLANASGAILDMDAGDIYRDRRLYAVERRQMREALAVMRRLGVRPVALPGAPIPWLARGFRLPDWFARPIFVRVVDGARGGKLPSLRSHVWGGRGPSEAAWLNGAVASHAAALHMRAPVNARLAALVDEVAADPVRREFLRHRPERLLDELGRRESAPVSGPILPGDADS